MALLPESYKRSYFTTARVIHDTTDREPKSNDWLWINTSENWQFDTVEEAQEHANQSNENGKNSGLDVRDYPYFPVKVTQETLVEKI